MDTSKGDFMARKWMLNAATMLAATFFIVGANAAEGEIGQVKTVFGDVVLIHDGASSSAAAGTAVFENDVVKTGADGSVGITFSDNTVISAGPNTELALDEYSYNPSTLEGTMLADLLAGTVAIDSGDMVRGSSEAMKVKTPSAILGVRGTKFLVRVGGGAQQ
jgi:hypothetical protein